jgi:hypothetical protein
VRAVFLVWRGDGRGCWYDGGVWVWPGRNHASNRRGAVNVWAGVRAVQVCCRWAEQGTHTKPHHMLDHQQSHSPHTNNITRTRRQPTANETNTAFWSCVLRLPSIKSWCEPRHRPHHRPPPHASRCKPIRHTPQPPVPLRTHTPVLLAASPLLPSPPELSWRGHRPRRFCMGSITQAAAARVAVIGGRRAVRGVRSERASRHTPPPIRPPAHPHRRPQRAHEVGYDQLQPLQPVALCVVDHLRRVHHAQQQHEGSKGVKAQAEGVPHRPAHDGHKRDGKQANLWVCGCAQAVQAASGARASVWTRLLGERRCRRRQSERRRGTHTHTHARPHTYTRMPSHTRTARPPPSLTHAARAHLHTAADGHAEREVHLVLRGHKHGGDVLARVACDGQHDKAQEAARQAPCAADLPRSGRGGARARAACACSRGAGRDTCARDRGAREACAPGAASTHHATPRHTTPRHATPRHSRHPSIHTHNTARACATRHTRHTHTHARTRTPPRCCPSGTR